VLVTIKTPALSNWLRRKDSTSSSHDTQNTIARTTSEIRTELRIEDKSSSHENIGDHRSEGIVVICPAIAQSCDEEP
jgi:hypothetical protein